MINSEQNDNISSYRQNDMTHRIISVKPMDNMILSVVFQNGIEKTFDVSSLYDVFQQFRILEEEKHLFEEVQVDVGGYGISWNDELDIDANTIWEEGRETGVKQNSKLNSHFRHNYMLY